MAPDDVHEILAAIDEIDRRTNDSWLEGLSERKRLELEFHNRDRDPEFVRSAELRPDVHKRYYANKKFHKTTHRSAAYVNGWIEANAPGRIFLDYACGDGSNALKAAKAGASLALGLDISDVSVRNCRRHAEEERVENVRYFQADAEETGLPDDSVDVVICSEMLHHLDLSSALPELQRILRPGGKILAVEALGYNPLINLYRKLTPDMRTDWERRHILTLKHVRFASKFFDVGAVRYWHVIGYAGGALPILARFLDQIDRGLEKIWPINRFAWVFTFELTRPKVHQAPRRP